RAGRGHNGQGERSGTMRRILIGMTLGLALLAGRTALAQVTTGQPVHTPAQIIRVDPAKQFIVVRVGEGQTAKELQYHFVPASKMWGPDKAPLTDPTRMQMLKEGTPVWYRLGQGVDNTTITEMRLFNPETPPLGGG